MKILGVIPARYNSSRFPGKPLANIGGKSMIERVYTQARKCDLLSELYVATDDDRIFSHVKSFGGEVLMTGEHSSGTGRCNALYKNLKKEFDVIINIQGDEPFINPEQISQLADCFLDENTTIATLAKQIKTAEQLLDENTVKVMFDKNNFALNFSRLAIPQPKSFDVKKWFVLNTFYKHIGIYGYSAKALEKICELEPTKRELNERLEQLRWLENGYKIKVGITTFESISVDVPKDIEKLNL